MPVSTPILRILPVLLAVLALVHPLQAQDIRLPELQNYGKTITVKKPIVVESGESFSGKLSDGKWTLYTADRKRLGDGSQDEGQLPLFILKPGARLEHVIIDHPAADGIHVESADGRITVVREVQFRSVGEDAITVMSGDNDAYVMIDRCVFLNAKDKVVQINATARVMIEDCYAEDFGTFARTSGTSGDQNYRVSIDDLVARDGRTVLKMSNPRASGEVSNSDLENIDRVVDTSRGAWVEVENVRTWGGGLLGASNVRDFQRGRHSGDFDSGDDDTERKTKLILRILDGLSNLE